MNTDEQDLEVAELCGRDPRAQQIRGAMFRVERQGGDWDSDPLPRLFTLYADTASPKVAVRYSDGFTHLVREMMAESDGDAGGAIVRIAKAAEFASEHARSAFPDVGDLMSGEAEGWEFYGMGLRAEAWGLAAPPEGRSDLLRSAEARQIHAHPERVELRFVHLADRESRIWTVTRIRGEEAKAALYLNDNPREGVGGNIPNGLTRFVAAAVANKVHIVPYGREDE